MEKKVKLDTTQKLQLAGAAILLLCILPLPYGFYTIVRIVTTIISAYLAYEYFSRNKNELGITFTIIAVLFQPFIKFAIGRDVWIVIDFVVAILLLMLAIRKK